MNKRKLILIIIFGLSISLNIIFIRILVSVFKFGKIKKVPIQVEPKSIVSTPLNNFDYSYLINTNKNYCGRESGKDLLFIAFVPASPKSFEKRDLIRSTWANNKYLKSKAKVIFLIGRSTESIVNLKIKNESLKYADIVQNDFMDTYYNLTIKTIMGFKWVSNFCQNAKYTLKIDDDVVVNIPFLIDYLEGLVKKNTNQKNTLIGKCFESRGVIRDINSKFYISKDEFKEDYYVQYCEGPAYTLSTDLALSMYNSSLYTEFFKFEDVYVGVLAKNLNSTFSYINKNYRYPKKFNKYCDLEDDDQLNEKYFIYSADGDFKDIWNFLEKYLFK